MAIPQTQEHINVGVENQAAGSDSLYDAFTKIEKNFDTLFGNASPYSTFNGGNGISISSYSSNGTVDVVNTGVLNVVGGTGITALTSNGTVTLSVSGNVTGNIVAGVTSIGVKSPTNTLTVSNSPIISNGNITVDLPTTGITAGEYVAPTMTVDAYGRVTGITSTSSTGTVTSVALVPGDGISVTGTNPITSSGSITITNSGVTKINAGPGILLSGQTGEITVSTLVPRAGTVTSVNVTSNTLVVTGGPVTSSGTINIELASTENLSSLSANIVSANFIFANSALSVTGTTTLTGNVTTNGNLTVTDTTNSSGTGTGAFSVAGGGSFTKDLYVGGTIYAPNYAYQNSTTIEANAALLYLTASPTYPYNYDVGFYSHFTGGAGNLYQHTGFVRNHNDNKWYLFSNAAEPSGGTVNLSNANLVLDSFKAGNLELTGLANIVGNITAGNASLGNLVSANYVSANGSLLTSLAGGNVTGQVGNSLIAGTVYTAAQPNITSTGTLASTTLQANANITMSGALSKLSGANLVSANYATVSSNLTVGNSAVGNITTYDLYSSNTVTVANTGYLILNTVANNSKFVALGAPTSIAGSYILWQLPNTAGTTGQYLTQNGGGVMSWSNVTISNSAPLTASSTGTAGQIAYDATHIYVCVATNTWLRADLASW